MNKSLYEIKTEYLEAIQALEDNIDQELNDEEMDAIFQALEINEEDLKDKAEAYAAVISQKLNRAAYLKLEAKRLTDMAKKEEKVVSTLKDNLAGALQMRGGEPLDTNHFRMLLRKSERVHVADENAIPEQYKVTKQTVAPDKKAIKEAIKRGEAISGAALLESYTVQIK